MTTHKYSHSGFIVFQAMMGPSISNSSGKVNGRFRPATWMNLLSCHHKPHTHNFTISKWFPFLAGYYCVTTRAMLKESLGYQFDCSGTVEDCFSGHVDLGWYFCCLQIPFPNWVQKHPERDASFITLRSEGAGTPSCWTSAAMICFSKKNSYATNDSYIPLLISKEQSFCHVQGTKQRIWRHQWFNQ